MPQFPPNETHLIAGPPAANPPLGIAILLVALSLAAPVLFLKAGAPSPLFGIIILALATAGIITMLGAITAQRRRRADGAIRARASISQSGLTLRPGTAAGTEQYFAVADIKSAHLLPRALVIQTTEAYPNPGRYVLRFGKPQTPPEPLHAALAALLEKPKA